MDRIEIRLAGSGGQGLILGMHILFRALGLEGKRAAQSQSYEPTSRGGFCYSDLIVTDDPSDYPLVTRLDMIAGLSQIGLDRSLALVKPGALVIVDERLVPQPPNGFCRLHVLPISQRAIALGSPRIANIIALGALARLAGVCGKQSLETAVRLDTPKKFADLNLAAVQEGFALAAGSSPSSEAQDIMQAIAS
jgi:2-oxoglutarate ferredoxin oxidoreductase subunit gamma